MSRLLALAAGVLNALSFAPFEWWPLNLLSLAVLFGLWLRQSPRAAAWHGFIFGLGMFGVGISWMYVSVHNFGGMPPVAAGLLIALLVAGMSLFPLMAALFQGLFTRRTEATRLILIMPFAWIAFEWLRGWVLTGLPWLTTGYAMLDTPLAGLAPVGGVYLLSLVTLTTVGALLALAHRATPLAIAAVLVVAAAWATGWHWQGRAWTQPDGEPFSVAIVQNNVPLMLKWDSEESDRIVAAYLEASSAHRDRDLVVWPEAAVPEYLDLMPSVFWQFLANHPADFVFGALTRSNIDGQTRFFNSIAAVSDRVEIYRKQHLVPFGEFYPFPELLAPIIDRLAIPMSNFSHWPTPQAPLNVAGRSFAASICYEDAFPSVWRNQVPYAGFLLNVSEDMWFGDSLAPHQRLQMARFRSLETGRPMIRASNNGLSSTIDWLGRVDAIAPQFVAETVTASVQPRAGVTPYTEQGDWPALLLALLAGLGGMLFGARQLR